MGWTEYRATHLYSNGAINRKAECDAYFTESLNSGYYKIVKSTMKGSVYYGAIMPLKRVVKDSLGVPVMNGNWYVYEDIPEDEREVFGVVMLTYTRDGSFGYKIISETSGPNYYDCPASVLKVLTPTSSAYALDWRKKCEDNLKKPSIANLPIGTEIEFMCNGKNIVLRKSPPRYQFKTSFWINDADFTYFSKKRIPKDFKIVSMPTKAKI